MAVYIPLLQLILVIFTFVFIIVKAVKSPIKKIKTNEIVSSNFESYALEILKDNFDIAKARFKHRLQSFLSFICFVLFMGLMMYGLSQNFGFPFMLVPIIFLIIFIVLMVTRKDDELFNVAVDNVIKKYNKDLTYNHKEGINSKVYREAKFESWDRYRSDDLFKGKIENCEFEMSEVHTERRHTDKDGHTHYTTIFHGTFAKVKMDKNFGGFLSIINNKIKLFNKDQYITIDNEAFEKIYDVFTDDKIKAMRLLTPDVTTQMIDLYNDTGLYCEVKIIGEYMYIRLFTGPLFSLSFSRPEKEAKLIGRTMAIMDIVFKIMNKYIDEIERFDV